MFPVLDDGTNFSLETQGIECCIDGQINALEALWENLMNGGLSVSIVVMAEKAECSAYKMVSTFYSINWACNSYDLPAGMNLGSSSILRTIRKKGNWVGSATGCPRLPISE